MMALHRLARFCVVSSLDDGMNLVAKEFVASRIDQEGILVLSHFTGSSRELADAVQFNPFAIDELKNAIVQALEMDPTEEKRRMQRMQAIVKENNVYRWAGKILSTLLKIDTPDIT
jgi:trehalose 6-phosphate synthase